MAYITLDFGSSNSGAVLNTAFEREYNPSDLIFVHKQEGDAGFTKQPTIFWIKRSLLEKTSYSESDINIFSCVFYDEEKYLEDANFIWCQNQIKKCIPALSKSRDWVRVQHPKMELYKVGNSDPSNTKIRTSDGTFYPLTKILNIFFLVIKKECMQKAVEAGLRLSADEINWAITVPGLAIWNPESVEVIKSIATRVFGEKVTLLSEPECALIGINISGKAQLDFVKDRYSLIADLGGGTADICVMKETLNPDGVTSFNEIKSTKKGKDSTTSERAGGNDIDNYFTSFFCEYLAQNTGLEDSPIWLYTDFVKENPAGAMEFDKRWRTLQFSDDIEADIVSFNPGRAYLDWLKTHWPAAAKKRDEFGDFNLDGKALRNYVFTPVYDIILKSLEDNLKVLKQKRINLDTVYFAGGLSLDKHLKKQIKNIIKLYFPYASHKEASDGAVVGAVQRGGNHISANKDTLIHRMSRKTFYTEFVMEYNGDDKDLRDRLGGEIRSSYYEHFGVWLEEADVRRIVESQWNNKTINYSAGTISYLSPLCLKFAPVTQIQSFDVSPTNKGNQTGACIKVYSSNNDLLIFKSDETKYEGEFEYDFGYNWESAKLVFDPTSNAVEGSALFYLADVSGKKLKEYIIHNVSKRGI